ncbi:unnamed protein product [Chironomus riparius]|uniref:Uncharacterized protein n=1 Tax=Chironomus riparius TaxID=315576 RepID=A0A9N9S3C7_9DIPT|nr:unnamed protein product [Chironomus riparius]
MIIYSLLSHRISSSSQFISTMIFKIFVIINAFTVGSLASTAYGITANCDYGTHVGTMGPLSRPYRCTIAEQPVRGDVVIDNVIGKHEAGKTNTDVAVANVKNIKSDRIPSGLAGFFPNVEGIFAFASLKTILLNEDLRSFPKLKYIDISQNRITSLPSDVFEDNPQMEWIDISDNRIKLVGLDILKNLKKLHYANFGTNYCIDELARDKTDIERTLKPRLVSMCQSHDVPYFGTTISPGGKIRTTSSYVIDASEDTTTVKPGFWKKIFG